MDPLGAAFVRHLHAVTVDRQALYTTNLCSAKALACRPATGKDVAMKPNPFAVLLREHMARLGINNQQAADVLGCSPSTIQSWLSGRTLPIEGYLEKIRDVWGPQGWHSAVEAARKQVPGVEGRVTSSTVVDGGISATIFLPLSEISTGAAVRVVLS